MSKKPTSGTFSLTYGSVTSAPLRFNASQKKIDATWIELIEENEQVQAIRAVRAFQRDNRRRERGGHRAKS